VSSTTSDLHHGNPVPSFPEQLPSYLTYLLDQLADIVVTTDADFRVRTWNREATRFFGWSTEEAQGKLMGDLVSFEYPGAILDEALNTLLQSGCWKGEVIYRSNPVRQLHFLYTVSYMPDLGGSPGYLAVGKDISSQKVAEEKLHRRERFFTGLVSDSLDGLILVDVDGRISFAAPSVHHVLGYHWEEMLGKPAFDYVHPDDLPKALEAFTLELTSNPEVKFIVVRLRCSNGEWKWCTVRGNNLLANPDVKGIVIYFHDDTPRRAASEARRSSEERLRTVMRHIQQGVVLQNAQGEVILANEAATRLLGLEENQLLGKKALDPDWKVVNEGGVELPFTEHSVAVALRTGKPVRNMVVGIIGPRTVQTTWLLVNTDLIFDASGGLQYIISSYSDITERRTLQEQLLAAHIGHQRQLTQATIDSSENERKEIGKELHDNIGQQLTTIKLFLDLARSTADEETAEMIALATRNVSDVINEIRALCRSLIPSSLGDLGLVASINDLLHQIGRTRQLEIDFDATQFDEDRVPDNQKLMLFRVVQEQINNVVKHAGARQVSILLAQESGGVYLSISDDGAGFDPATVKRGLGLANMRNRTEMFAGNLEVISAPGKGCTLKAWIPEKEE